MTLLGQLPAKIRAYEKTALEDRTVIVLMDLDDKDLGSFETELRSLVTSDALNIKFCFAIEELEAWFLADKPAILAAYPKAVESPIDAYVQDSICGTWEVLASSIEKNILTYPKRDRRLLNAKYEWAKKISPHLNIDINQSPSFIFFKNTLLESAT